MRRVCGRWPTRTDDARPRQIRRTMNLIAAAENRRNKQPDNYPQRPALDAYGDDVVQAQQVISNNGW